MRQSKLQSTLDTLIIALFGLFPIIPNSIKGLPVILLFITSIIRFVTLKKNGKGNLSHYKLKVFAIMASVYGFYLTSIFYTNNLANYGYKLEIGLSLLIVPLSFLLSSHIITNNNKLLFKRVFIGSITTYSVVFLILLAGYENKKYPRGFWDVNFIRESLGDIPFIGTHPIYVSIFLGIGIILTLSMCNKLRFYIVLPVLMLLTSSLVLLASKMAIISLVLLLLLYIIYAIKSLWLKWLALVTTIGCVTLLVLFVPSLNDRFKELYLSASYSSVDKYNSTSIRAGINACNIELLKGSWLLGYGIGDVQTVLNECYQTKSDVLVKNNYNTHNQYVGVWLGTGVVGFVAFILMLIFAIKMTYNKGEVAIVAILLFYSLNFLTENVLERQSGVILFAFLINIFGFCNAKN